uniref:Uncharacterized protein LOC100179735 n=1 Tax=Phallusia mammillata TaxID=59560 RepID=A0A6F9DHR8_9ASCI|nr:uncharacterized protein LOC100179735 [Phallusia mammillata]
MQSSTQSVIVRSALIILLYVIVACDARPTSQSTETVVHPKLMQDLLHTRTTSRKRHAEIRVSSQISRSVQELRRKMLLNGMMHSFDNKQIKIYPSRIPHRKLNPDILNQIDGNEANGLRVRVINTNPTRMPTTSEQYYRYVQQSHDAAAVAKTCQDMQQLLARNHLRVRVSCKTTPSRRRVPFRFSSHRFTN